MRLEEHEVYGNIDRTRRNPHGVLRVGRNLSRDVA